MRRRVLGSENPHSEDTTFILSVARTIKSRRLPAAEWRRDDRSLRRACFSVNPCMGINFALVTVSCQFHSPAA